MHGIENSVLFISYGGKTYSDNPRAISEALHEKYPKAKICWLNKERSNSKAFPDYVHLIDRNDAKEYFKAIGTIKVIVDNSSDIPIIHKAKCQYFIQTWHGDRAFKKIMYDSKNFKKNEVGESIKGYYDLVISGSDYGDMQYRSAFKYQGEILKVGTPRNDCLVKQDPRRIKEIKEKLGIAGKKVILYAPTFRKKYKGVEQKQNIDNINIDTIIHKLEEKNCEAWIGLLRGHPDINGITGYHDSSVIMDVSSYQDMADLLLISDILITDYSSCAGDFALTKRMIILFQPDLEEYTNNERGLYFDMKESPYYIVKNQKELENLIMNHGIKQAEKNCEEILDFYKTIETGKSANIIADIIAEKIL